MEEKLRPETLFIWNDLLTRAVDRFAPDVTPSCDPSCSRCAAGESQRAVYRLLQFFSFPKHKSVGLLSLMVNWTCWFQDMKSKHKTINTDKCQLQNSHFFSYFTDQIIDQWTAVGLIDHSCSTCSNESATCHFLERLLCYFPSLLTTWTCNQLLNVLCMTPRGILGNAGHFRPCNTDESGPASIKTGCDHLLIVFFPSAFYFCKCLFILNLTHRHVSNKLWQKRQKNRWVVFRSKNTCLKLPPGKQVHWKQVRVWRRDERTEEVTVRTREHFVNCCW